MAQRAPIRPTTRIEEAIGFVGCFGVLFLGITVFCEVTGRPALAWALTLLVCVLGVLALNRWRTSVLRRTADAERAIVRTAAAAPVTIVHAAAEPTRHGADATRGADG
ncbi:hypothetical protein [Curtobacterium sp. ISL-83]|uniref:hypothetical protein n=1 Tax=Curtobacterium sp. ISL-83 TaxID=2819145 RepID=UPI001BE818C8|nr:hypothetical protein [Curtobacterium sp. ISL-83]MBT2501639.1 hypothetical protein [Curtobacterium sp. ISL-83]